MGILAGLLAGCTVVGPAAVRNGRLTYNEAINETNNQQMLLAVVRNRYDETANLLAVASVTANVRVAASTGVQLGFGDSDNYRANLVPLSVGGVYEENPTISYVPVAGASYAEQIFSPVPLTALARLTGSLADPAYVYSALVARVNGIQNPNFLVAAQGPDPQFDRLLQILTKLTQANCLQWAEDPQEDDQLSIVIDHYVPNFESEVRELLVMLDLPEPENGSPPLVLPVFPSLDGRQSGGLGVTTRSVGDLVEMLSGAIEVPESDQQRGVAAAYPPPGPAGKNLSVRYSEDRPDEAAVAVQYRDGWFYISETDQATKRFFRLLNALWSVSIAESTANSGAAPVLTVPVSR